MWADIVTHFSDSQVQYSHLVEGSEPTQKKRKSLGEMESPEKDSLERKKSRSSQNSPKNSNNCGKSLLHKYMEEQT